MRLLLQDPHYTKPERPMIGKDESGKEYPERLCAGLAWTLVQGLTSTARSSSLPSEGAVLLNLKAWVEDLAKISNEIHADAVWLPDFQNGD